MLGRARFANVQNGEVTRTWIQPYYKHTQVRGLKENAKKYKVQILTLLKFDPIEI